ncbi:MAG: VOC family protein [Bryobacteraceae bacterium]
MPNIDKNPPGSFCWIELGTTDQNAAKTFYTSLFGWTVNDHPMGPNDVYTMFQLEGREAAAAYTIRPEQRAQGVPPHWMIYIAVDSADDAVNKAGRLGGKVMVPAFDVFDVGRMSVMQDPTGATFSVWQAKNHKGVGIRDVPGSLCWADLNTSDPEPAGKFYSDLFGWKLEPGKDGGYLHIKNGDSYIGGVPKDAHLDAHTPPHWLAYFYVAKCDAAVEKAKQLGGKLFFGPHEIPETGILAVMADPQGAVFAVYESKH